MTRLYEGGTIVAGITVAVALALSFGSVESWIIRLSVLILAIGVIWKWVRPFFRAVMNIAQDLAQFLDYLKREVDPKPGQQTMRQIITQIELDVRQVKDRLARIESSNRQQVDLMQAAVSADGPPTDPHGMEPVQ